MNTRSVLTLCTALVLGATLIAGPATAAGKADEKTPINDTWLTAKTKIALAADGRSQRAADRGRDHKGRRDAPRQGRFRRGQACGGGTSPSCSMASRR